MDKIFQAERLKQARATKRFTLEELSERVDVTKQSLSLYENGERSPSPATLSRLSSTLDVPLRFFFKPLGQLESSNRSAINFRSLEKTRKVAKERERASALFSFCASLFDVVNESVSFSAANIPQLLEEKIDPAELSRADIESIGLELRAAWGLGRGPISDLTLLVENNSIPVVTTTLSEGMEGLSGWFDDRPFVITSSSSGYFRGRMNVAHELGHLVLHRDVTEEQLENRKFFRMVEDQAWTFAGAFLMPSSSFAAEIYSVSLDGLLSLKKRWGVAVAAMIQRLDSLGIIDERKKRSLHVQKSQRKWGRQEPFDSEFEAEKTQLLRHVVQTLDEHGVLKTSEVARVSGLPLWFLIDALDLSEAELTGEEPGSNVVSFRLREERSEERDATGSQNHA